MFSFFCAQFHFTGVDAVLTLTAVCVCFFFLKVSRFSVSPLPIFFFFYSQLLLVSSEVHIPVQRYRLFFFFPPLFSSLVA